MQHGNVEVTGQIQGLHDVGFINHTVLLQGLVHVELSELKLAAAGSACNASTESSQGCANLEIVTGLELMPIDGQRLCPAC